MRFDQTLFCLIEIQMQCVCQYNTNKGSMQRLWPACINHKKEEIFLISYEKIIYQISLNHHQMDTFVFTGKL